MSILPSGRCVPARASDTRKPTPQCLDDKSVASRCHTLKTQVTLESVAGFAMHTMHIFNHQTLKASQSNLSTLEVLTWIIQLLMPFNTNSIQQSLAPHSTAGAPGFTQLVDTRANSAKQRQSFCCQTFQIPSSILHKHHTP